MHFIFTYHITHISRWFDCTERETSALGLALLGLQPSEGRDSSWEGKGAGVSFISQLCTTLVPARQGLLSHLHPKQRVNLHSNSWHRMQVHTQVRMYVCVHMWVCLTACNGPAHSPWAQVNPYHHTGQREGLERAGQRIKTQTRTQWRWPLKQFHFPNTPSINCFNSNSAELKSRGTVVRGTLRKWSEDGRKHFLSWVSGAEAKHYDLSVQTSLLLSHSPFLQFTDVFSVFSIFFSHLPGLMCCLPSWREIPMLKVTELELKFILASSHPFILSFTLYLQCVCTRHGPALGFNTVWSSSITS